MNLMKKSALIGLFLVPTAIGAVRTESKLDPFSTYQDYSDSKMKKVRINITWVGSQLSFVPGWFLYVDESVGQVQRGPTGGGTAVVSCNEMRIIIDVFDAQMKVRDFEGAHPSDADLRDAIPPQERGEHYCVQLSGYHDGRFLNMWIDAQSLLEWRKIITEKIKSSNPNAAKLLNPS